MQYVRLNWFSSVQRLASFARMGVGREERGVLLPSRAESRSGVDARMSREDANPGFIDG